MYEYIKMSSKILLQGNMNVTWMYLVVGWIMIYMSVVQDPK